MSPSERVQRYHDDEPDWKYAVHMVVQCAFEISHKDMCTHVIGKNW